MDLIIDFLHRRALWCVIILLIVFGLLLAGMIDHEVIRNKTIDRNKNETKILVKWGQIDGKIGPVGDIPDKYKVEKLTNSKGKTGYLIKFQKGAIITSEKGTYYMEEIVFLKWKENFSELGFPIRDPYPDYSPDNANHERI